MQFGRFLSVILITFTLDVSSPHCEWRDGCFSWGSGSIVLDAHLERPKSLSLHLLPTTAVLKDAPRWGRLPRMSVPHGKKTGQGIRQMEPP